MRKRWYPWLLVALLWAVALLNYVDRQVIFSVFPLLSAELATTNVQLGLLSTVFLWVYGVFSPVSGFLADRFGRARSISVSLLVWSAVTLATGLARTYPQLIVARALMGISEACYLPAALAKIAEHHEPKTRSLAIGLHHSGLYVGMILGGAGGGWIGQHYGWRMSFLLLGAIGIGYFCIVFLFFRKEPKVRQVRENSSLSLGESFGELSRLSGFWTMALVFAAVAAANWLVYTWLPLYVYERFHMTLAAAGFTATFYIQIASLAGIIVGGYFSDRLSQRTSRGRLYIQAAGVLLAAPFLFLLGYTKSYALLLAALVLFGIGRGFYECNTMPVLCQIARNEVRSTGYGVFNLAGCLVGGVFAVLAGAFKNLLGLANVFQITAAILLLSGLLLIQIRSRLSDPSRLVGATTAPESAPPPWERDNT
jgi:MFS family permease